MADRRPFHEVLTDVSRAYSEARRDWERAMRSGNRDRISETYSRVQLIESCVEIRLKKPLPI
jgi:hypothetical protein